MLFGANGSVIPPKTSIVESAKTGTLLAPLGTVILANTEMKKIE